MIIQNYRCYKEGNITAFLTVITAFLSTVLLFSTNTADKDWSEVQLDMSGYKTVYESYDVLEHPDFTMYYLFYGCMYFGQELGLSFRFWWAMMSIAAMIIVFFACKFHKYSFNIFLATFMAYYEFTFYSGFKFFYGFCVYLLAFGFLLRNSYKDKLIYVLITCLSGGFHVMYYFFLLFVIKPQNDSKSFTKIIIVITILFTIILRLSGSAVSVMAPFFNFIDNEHINVYTSATVNWGFYIAFILHLVVIYAIRTMRVYKINTGTYSSAFDSFYCITLLSVLFVPFYTIALTFMRLLTSFSLVLIVASSCLLSETKKDRSLCANMSLLVSFSFLIMKLVTSIGLPRTFLEVSILPFFDIF